MTELLEQQERSALIGRAARSQVTRRWVSVVLMAAAAALGLLYAFPDWGGWASSTSSGTAPSGHWSSMAPILLVGTGVLVTVAMVLPSALLARRVWRRSARVSWCTIGLAAGLAVSTVAQANSIWVLACFLASGTLMALVGLPLSRFRPVA